MVLWFYGFIYLSRSKKQAVAPGKPEPRIPLKPEPRAGSVTMAKPAEKPAAVAKVFNLVN